MDRRETRVNRWYDSFDQRTMRATIEELDPHDDPSDGPTSVPVIYEVCDVCDGRGTYVNPSIDSHGIGADEWNEWDDDEREDYCSGRYDVGCHECGGLRVVPVPDYQAMSLELARAVQDQIQGAYDDARERAAERAMGC